MLPNFYAILSITMSSEEKHEDGYRPRSRDLRKIKYFDPHGRTATAERKERTERARARRSEELVAQLRVDLDSFPKSTESGEYPKVLYLEWLSRSLANPETPSIEDEIQYEQSLASGHGGQNIQKTATSFVAIHLPSGIRAKSEDERSALINKQNAKEELEKRIRTHLARWSELTKIRRKAHQPTNFNNILESILGV